MSGSHDADAVLLTCYGIDCITPNRGCGNVTETDARRDAAVERLHERRCSDGLVDWAIERPGWEFGCEDFVPDDVECLVIDARHQASLPGLLDVSGECVVPDCTVETPPGEPQPGHRSIIALECIPIDRPPRANSDTNS